MREELGLNPHTTPEIQSVLRDLATLGVPRDGILRPEIVKSSFSNRVQLAMNFGGLIADGFLMVASRDSEGIRELGPALIRQARSLAVGEKITRRSSSLTDLAKQGRWQEFETELLSMQADVEAALIELRDEELIHLISLGGWLRGLDLVCGLVLADYTESRAAILARPEKPAYFLDRLETLNPSLRQTDLVREVEAAVRGIHEIERKLGGNPPARESVASIQALARKANRAITGQKR
jgi:hypothetical protein